MVEFAVATMHCRARQNAWTAFHCHGGAFVSTGLDEYHFYAEIIARQTGCRVVMPDYRLAPEHPYPAAPDDCFNAYCGLLEHGVPPATIVLLGESCGGSLALGLLVRLRDAGLPLPACFVSLTGWFDLSVSGETVPGRDPFLTPQWVRNRGRDYLAGQLDLDDPRYLPPTQICATCRPCTCRSASSIPCAKAPSHSPPMRCVQECRLRWKAGRA